MEPKFLLSKSRVMSQYDKVHAVSDIVSYSSKTNPLVLGILESNTSCMFSIHMESELRNVSDKSRVLFFAQGWDASVVQRLVGLGVRWFVVDNEVDLQVLLDSIEIKVNLLLRLKLKENTLRTERYFVFGMESGKVNVLVRDLRNNSNIGKLGIHFHRKTQNLSEWNLKYELEEIIDVWSLLDVVNIGGGLPSVYANTNKDVVDLVVRKIMELKEWFNDMGIQMMVEPGRFIAAPAGRLVTTVLGVYSGNVIVNASVYNTDLDALVVPVKLLVEGELKKGEGKAYTIKGVTPCSMDLFRYRVYLSSVKVGDTITFLNAGAYNFSSDFCDMEKVETEIVE